MDSILEKLASNSPVAVAVILMALLLLKYQSKSEERRALAEEKNIERYDRALANCRQVVIENTASNVKLCEAVDRLGERK